MKIVLGMMLCSLLLVMSQTLLRYSGYTDTSAWYGYFYWFCLSFAGVSVITAMLYKLLRRGILNGGAARFSDRTHLKKVDS